MTMSLLTLFLSTSCGAQIKNAKTESVKVYGVCGMCETRIEKAAFKKGEAKADWDTDSGIAQITYDSVKTSLDVVLQRIAAAGHDSDKFTATDQAYADLPGCCQYERPKKAGAPDNTALEMKVAPAPEAASAPAPMDKMVKKQANTEPVAMQSPVSGVYSAYFSLKDALVASDGSAASANANTLLTAIGNVKMDALPAAQHMVWMKYQQKLITDAGRIKAVTDVKSQREYFAALSANMYEVMKAIKPETEVYFDHCPMYNDGKGADWLSKDKVIQNPYYGKAMLSCGKTIEVLK